MGGLFGEARRGVPQIRSYRHWPLANKSESGQPEVRTLETSPLAFVGQSTPAGRDDCHAS
jgi:hypothetical protein